MTLPTAVAVRGLAFPSLSGAAEDTKIDTLIATADAALAGWCGFPAATVGSAKTLEVATYTQYLNGPSVLCPLALNLGVRPVTGITSIHDDRNRDWTYDATDLVDSGDYTLDGDKGQVWLHTNSAHGSWSKGPRILKVIYTAGFDTGAHAQITRAIAELVAHWWALKPTAGLESSTLAGDTETPLAREIPDHVQQLMAEFRMWEVGFG